MRTHHGLKRVQAMKIKWDEENISEYFGDGTWNGDERFKLRVIYTLRHAKEIISDIPVTSSPNTP